MYTVKMFQSDISMEAFIRRYRDAEKYKAYCRACPNYNTRWSCPPLTFDAEEELAKYRHVAVVALKMTYDEDTIKQADTAEKIKSVTWDTLMKEKAKMEERLGGVEAEITGSRGLSSGGCHRCTVCTRTEGKPCRFPDKMRYSLDSLGFDLSAITQDLLGIKLCWCTDTLPPYYTLIHALFLADDGCITDGSLPRRIDALFADVETEKIAQ